MYIESIWWFSLEFLFFLVGCQHVISRSSCVSGGGNSICWLSKIKRNWYLGKSVLHHFPSLRHIKACSKWFYTRENKHTQTRWIEFFMQLCSFTCVWLEKQWLSQANICYLPFYNKHFKPKGIDKGDIVLLCWFL